MIALLIWTNLDVQYVYMVLPWAPVLRLDDSVGVPSDGRGTPVNMSSMVQVAEWYIRTAPLAHAIFSSTVWGVPAPHT